MSKIFPEPCMLFFGKKKSVYEKARTYLREMFFSEDEDDEVMDAYKEAKGDGYATNQSYPEGYPVYFISKCELKDGIYVPTRVLEWPEEWNEVFSPNC